jgi:hypothetical protein
MSKYPYHRGSHYIYDLLLPFKVPLLAKLLGLTTIGLIGWILLTGEEGGMTIFANACTILQNLRAQQAVKG